MAHPALRQIPYRAGSIIALALLLFASLTLMSEAIKNSTRFGELYSLLLFIHAIGLLGLIGIIGWNLLRLLRQVRRKVAGALLTVRLLLMFVVLAVTPLLVVYYFSVQFLHQSIDSWFDLKVEQVVEDALELSRVALGVRQRELLKQMEAIAVKLAEVPEDQVDGWLDDARQFSGAAELTLMAPKGSIFASSSTDPMDLVPRQPGDAILLQLRQWRNYIDLDASDGAGLHIRVVVNVPGALAPGEAKILQGLFPIPERMGKLAEEVQTAYAKYKELAYLREPLKTSFTLMLSLVLLFGLLTALWAAFFWAQRMVAPLRDVVQGTRAVSEGDYETQLPQANHDEIGFLVESFNDMTRKLARARDETRRSQYQMEKQRTYLEAVLSRLSSGVVTLNHDLRLVTTNKAAADILGVDLNQTVGETPDEISRRHPHVAALFNAPKLHDAQTSQDWREEIILFGASGRQVLMCRGTPLPEADNPLAGYVIVFDDLTTLLQAQKNAAWSEVARRLAHEIKNPLTPIQLSAERLRHKYLPRLPPADAEGLDNLTRTIIQQVEAMKEMVNAFSDYARSPPMHPKTLDLNSLITDMVEMYHCGKGKPLLQTRLDPHLLPLEGDADRLRQVLHNLIKNALESTGTRQNEIVIETCSIKKATRNFIEVRIQDRGTGFPPEIIDKVFEPYVTTKPKGTGLGLAIVKKIVEEHGGIVWAENWPEGGARVYMRFPVVSVVARNKAEVQEEPV